MISAKNISLTINQREILRGVDIALNEGEFIGLLGPNGSGKTSLMRALMRFETRAEGECNLWEIKARERAQYAAWLAQDRAVAWDMRVEDVVALGRTAWQKFGQKHFDDQTSIEAAIERLALQDFRLRRFQNLSGGERARVVLARALAQNTQFLLADEPIAALDPAHQIHAMQIFSDLAQEGRGVMISIHDLGLAARFCTKLILINEGALIAAGDADKVLSDENLRDVFGVEVYRDYQNGPIIQPIKIWEN